MRRDYVSPGLRVVEPDAAFPHLTEGDPTRHPWPYVRGEIPHRWLVDDRHPTMGFLNRDEAVLLHNIALALGADGVLEIGSWLGWSTVHLALAGVDVDVIDPAHDDADIRASVDASLASAGVADRVHLHGGASPASVHELAKALDRRWGLFFVDGNHEHPGPVADVLACLPHATEHCAFVFHDLAAPAVADAFRLLREKGFETLVYQTAQIMGIAWRGAITPVEHVPDPTVPWELPAHLRDFAVSGAPAAPEAPVTRAAALRDVPVAPSDDERPTVCVVSNEIVGPFKNGGIGTSMTGLAELLARSGLRVTILYTGAVWTPDVRMDEWVAHFRALGIDLVSLQFRAMARLAGPVRDVGFAVPHLVHEHLLAHPYDIVHLNDCCGDGSLAVEAKRLGVAHRDTLFVAAIHSPSEWVLELNGTLPSSPLLAAFSEAERRLIAGADVAWSPSAYLLDWVRERGFELPEATYVQQYVLPEPPVRAERAARDDRRVTEIVFFGRLEERKGLVQFCNALDEVAPLLGERGVRVTFLGKHHVVDGGDSATYLSRRARSWSFPTAFVTDLGQPDAVAYLGVGGRVAVIASPADNSPCTVYEALTAGIPFIAARVGGIPEIVASDDHADVLFEPTTRGLADALRRVVEHGGRTARFAVDPARTADAWLAFHRSWPVHRRDAGERAEPRTIAAVVDHAGRGALDRTLESLGACPWVHEVVVVDRAADGSAAADRVRVVDVARDGEEAVADAVRSLAADDVLLLHAGVTVDGGALAEMQAIAAGSRVDGLLPAAVTDGVRRRHVPPASPSPAFAYVIGATFTGGMLVRREVIVAARKAGALSRQLPFVGLADLVVTSGADIAPYPRAVLERPAELGVDLAPRTPARVAAYEDTTTRARYYMLAVGSDHDGARGTTRRRRVALALADSGMRPIVHVASRAVRRGRRLRADVAATSFGRRVSAARHR